MSCFYSTNKCLSSLIELQKWKKLNNTIGSSKKLNNLSCTCERCASESSLLHLACKFKPPLHIVRNLYALDPFNASQMDSNRRYPLHLAVEYQSSLEVVQFLIESHTLAAESRDIYGRTPLYIAVQQCKEKWKRQNMGGLRILFEATYMINIIDLLCDAYPALPLVEDENEMTVLEYAITAEVDGRVIFTLLDKMEKAHYFKMKNRSKALSSQRAMALV